VSIRFLFAVARGAVGAIGFALAAGLASPPAAAGESAAAANSVSAWVKAPYSAVRLIEAGTAGGRLGAGLQIKLDAGWKTYWRYPGEAGLPPRFDFSRSENVAAVEVAWPAPHRFESGGTVSIGYDGTVVFPLTVRPRDPARPVVLAADVSFAVCGTLCVPAEARISLPLAADPAAAPVRAAAVIGGGDAAAALQRALARVPRPAALGAGRPGALAIARVAIDRTATPWRATVEALAPPDAELFVEGPTEAWALPVPAPATATGAGRAQFAFDLDGAPAGAPLEGARLTLTLVSAAGAIETTLPLD
jgi:DsbC/DsbD-like thiol-disulfide interchange protein